MQTPFLGPAYSARSLNLASQQLINLYPEIVESKTGKSVGAFYMTPGLDFLVTCGSGSIRGLHVKGSKLYAVSGNKVYSVTASWSASLLGTITTTTGPVSIIDNGTQLAIFDSANGYLVDGSDTLSTLALPFSVPVTAAYQDGFGIVNSLGSTNWYQSNLFDLSTWQALNFATSQAKPTSIVSLASIHREVWLLKSTSTEIWINAGLSGFVFQRVDGVFPEVGCLAAFSVAKARESLIWLAQNDAGQGIVVMGEGYRTQRISTHAIETAIASYPTPSDAIAYCYEQEGHCFYVLTFVGGNATWAYDLSTHMWHQRAALSNGALNRHWGNAYAFFNGKCVVGDYLTGNLYAYNLNTATDNGAQRKWLRSWRALPKPTMTPLRFSSLQIDMQTGMGVPDGTSPQVMLRWSDDGAHNWSNPRIVSAGPTGATAKRVKFNRLGATRRNSGLDRVFELSSTDSFAVALLGAELE